MAQEKRIPNYLQRVVSDNWVLDNEWWVPVDTSKLPPGFFFRKGMQYRDCVDASNTGGGCSDPLPILKSLTAPDWWPTDAPPWDGFVITDIKPGTDTMQWLVFAANIKASAKLKPSVTYWTEDEWLWPAVLAGKGQLPVQIFPITGSNLVSVLPNVYLQPETRARCSVKVEQFWTVNPWTKKTLKTRPDVYAAATDVVIGYPGYQRTIKCLHQAVELPSYNTGSIRSIKYPATTVTTWTIDIVNTIREVGGRFFLERRTYYPPYDPLDRKHLPFVVGS